MACFTLSFSSFLAVFPSTMAKKAFRLWLVAAENPSGSGGKGSLRSPLGSHNRSMVFSGRVSRPSKITQNPLLFSTHAEHSNTVCSAVSFVFLTVRAWGTRQSPDPVEVVVDTSITDHDLDQMKSYQPHTPSDPSSDIRDQSPGPHHALTPFKAFLPEIQRCRQLLPLNC